MGPGVVQGRMAFFSAAGNKYRFAGERTYVRTGVCYREQRLAFQGGCREKMPKMQDLLRKSPCNEWEYML